MIMFFLLGMASLPIPTSAINPSNTKVKRIAFGTPMPSLDTYEIYHVVQIRQSWACLSDQTDHEGALGTCLVDNSRCGGTLIHPEFILTAAHCLMYWEIAVYYKDDDSVEHDDWVNAQKDIVFQTRFDPTEEWKKFEILLFALEGFIVVPKPSHTVYSEWALLMGSHDANRMTQKRHAVNVYPHRVYPKNILNHLDELALQKELNSWHDVALIRACQPFNIKRRQVELAPMLKTEGALRRQYERIVATSKVCLYVGFGRQDNDDKDALKAGYPRFPETLMMHTWRHSLCYSRCNSDLLIHPSTEHTCVLCSRHLGHNLGISETGDSGSPVTCEGKFVATYTRSAWSAKRNKSRGDSYPLHCIINSIGPDNLEHYKKEFKGPEYHPLENTRLRRFSFPGE